MRLAASFRRRSVPCRNDTARQEEVGMQDGSLSTEYCMYCSAGVDHSKTHQNFITTSMRLSFRTSSNLKTLTAERNFHDHRYRTRIIRKWKTIPASFAILVHMSLGYAMHTADKTPWARLDAFL